MCHEFVYRSKIVKIIEDNIIRNTRNFFDHKGEEDYSDILVLHDSRND